MKNQGILYIKEIPLTKGFLPKYTIVKSAEIDSLKNWPTFKSAKYKEVISSLMAALRLDVD